MHSLTEHHGLDYNQRDKISHVHVLPSKTQTITAGHFEGVLQPLAIFTTYKDPGTAEIWNLIGIFHSFRGCTFFLFLLLIMVH